MKLDQFIYLSEADLNKPVYRIFKLKYFNQFLESEENTLVKPIYWDDPYENFILNHKIETKKGPAKNMARKFIRGQCWTLKNKSDALWRIYSPNKCGIKVKTTIKKLFKTHNNYFEKRDNNPNRYFYIGKVQYDNESLFNQLADEFEQSPGFSPDGSLEAKTFLHKRNIFSYEEEVRIISFEWKKGAEDLFKIPCPPTDLIDEIILHPEMKKEKTEKLISKFCNYGFDNKSVRQSNLHTIDKGKLKILQLKDLS